MKKNYLIPFVTACFAIPCVISCNQHDTTCTIIKNNYIKYVRDNTNVKDYSSKSVYEIKSELTSPVIIDGMTTYKFKDVDYDTDWSRFEWKATAHLSKTLHIAIVAEDRNSDELRDVAKKLTHHWVFSNYHNINWWQNELGANSTLANLGLFTFDYLGKKGQDAFNGKIRESSLKFRPSLLSHTGANVFNYIDITCRNAAINNDREEMDIAFNRLIQEITDDKLEGFQSDGSFFQHGRQVQNVSYGKSVAAVAKIFHQLRGTDYPNKIPQKQLDILAKYILLGLRASIYKGYTNYTTVSREYSRPNNLNSQLNGFKDLKFFTEIPNFPYKEETNAFIDSIYERTNSIKQDEVIYFDQAKMIVASIGHDDTHEGIYISYKSSEPYMTNTECVNGENRLGLNLSYGTNTCVMDHGNEYFNIAPIMDYSYMPGTTSVTYSSDNHSDDDTLFHYANSVYGDSLYERHLPSGDSLGAKWVYNDGQIGDVTFSMIRSRHHERGEFIVTCIATTDGMVLVGSNFSYLSTLDPKPGEDYALKSNVMHTTVDQYITNDTESASTTANSIKNHNDGNVKYTRLDCGIDGQPLNFKKEVIKKTYKKEDWLRNNSGQDVTKAPEGEEYISTITIDNADSDYKNYAYAIQPSYNNKTFAVASNNKQISNDNYIHAIELPNGKIAAAFYDESHTSFVYNGKEYSLNDGEFIRAKGAFKIFDK